MKLKDLNRAANNKKLESLLKFQLEATGNKDFIEQYRFAAIHAGISGKGLRLRLAEAGLKDWRFDFAWPELMLAVECNGGQWVNGGHNRGSGYEKDLEKYDAAMRLGWSIYQCNFSMIKSGQAIKTIEQLINIAINNRYKKTI